MMGRPSRVAEYRACAEQGMTLSEAAGALGIARQSVYRTAQRHGIEFHGQRRRAHLAELTPQQRADYDQLLYRHRFTRAVALRMIGREDLV